MPANRKSTLAERALNKPYYFLRPSQAIRHAFRSGPSRAGSATVALAWGGTLDVFPSDEVGEIIWRTGVFELVVSETIARLLDPGELAVDAGANIGYMTRLMASRVGPHGRVIAYEPHPALHRVLRANAARAPEGSEIVVAPAALSERPGEGRLVLGAQFERNMGTASLATSGSDMTDSDVVVPVERLDDRVDDGARVGLLKVDVEGHELGVLRGAKRALAGRRIRDVVFEENDALPTPVTRLLEEAGYVIFGLDQRFLGPRLVGATELRARPLWDAPTYLATLDVDRARRRMRRRGWTVLRSRRWKKDRASQPR